MKINYSSDSPKKKSSKHKGIYDVVDRVEEKDGVKITWGHRVYDVEPKNIVFKPDKE